MRKRKWTKIICSLMVFALLFQNSAFIGKENMHVMAAAKKITLSNVDKKIVVVKGKTFSVKVRYGNKSIKKKKLYFQSSNPAVMTVSSKGKIKGIAKGKATLTVRLRSNYNVFKKVSVIVGKKVKSINVKAPAENQILQVGEKFYMKASVSPKSASYKTLSWKTSNKNVVTVSKKGTVTAKGDGEAIVEVMAQDSSKTIVRNKITVGKRLQQISFANVSQGEIFGVYESRKLEVSATPADATRQTYTWTSSNPSVISVDASGNIKALSEGEADISAAAQDNTGVSTSVHLTVRSGYMNASDAKFIAHRGYSKEAPENTLAAFELAGKEGFWGAECDVHLTKDREFVISHDDNLNRMYGVDATIENLDSKEIKQYICKSGNNVDKYPEETVPLLKEYLEVCKKYNMHPVIEIKDDYSNDSEAVRKLLDEAFTYFSPADVTIISFEEGSIEQVRNMNSEVQVQYLVSKYSATSLARCVEKRYDYNCKYTGISETQIANVKSRGIKMNLYTIDEKETAAKFVYNCGVEYITSNDKLFEN